MNEHMQISVNLSRHFEKLCKGRKSSRDSIRELCKSKNILKSAPTLAIREASIQPRTSLRKSMKVLKTSLYKTRKWLFENDKRGEHPHSSPPIQFGGEQFGLFCVAMRNGRHAHEVAWPKMLTSFVPYLTNFDRHVGTHFSSFFDLMT